MSDDEPFVASSKWYLDSAMVTGRYSPGLIGEFDAHVECQTANVFRIFAEIGTLEGTKAAKRSQTKPAAQFRGRWLHGLWHKHYTQATFMVENLRLHWTPDRLHGLVMKSFEGREFFDEQMAKEISVGFVQGGYLERANEGQLTGEWVVFARHDNVNYYLTLGTHAEADEAIWHRCKACAVAFPGLPIIQEDR